MKISANCTYTILVILLFLSDLVLNSLQYKYIISVHDTPPGSCPHAGRPPAPCASRRASANR